MEGDRQRIRNTVWLTAGVRCAKAPGAGQVNLPPSAGMQFFGEVQIAAKTAAMTLHLGDLTGASRWNTTIAPHRA